MIEISKLKVINIPATWKTQRRVNGNDREEKKIHVKTRPLGTTVTAHTRRTHSLHWRKRIIWRTIISEKEKIEWPQPEGGLAHSPSRDIWRLDRATETLFESHHRARPGYICHGQQTVPCLIWCGFIIFLILSIFKQNYCYDRNERLYRKKVKISPLRHACAVIYATTTSRHGRPECTKPCTCTGRQYTLVDVLIIFEKKKTYVRTRLGI